MTYWPEVLHQQAVLLAQLLGAPNEGAVAVFASLQNARARRDALAAAGKHFLRDERDIDLLYAVMTVVSAAESERNDLAHGCFGVSEAIPDGVLWIAPSDMSIWNAANIPGGTGVGTGELASYIYVYMKADLERIYDQIADAWTAAFRMNSYVHELKHWEGAFVGRCAELFGQLIAQPRVAEALNQIEAAKKSHHLRSDYFTQLVRLDREHVRYCSAGLSRVKWV